DGTDISVNPKRRCAPFQSTSVLAAGNTGSFHHGAGDRLFRVSSTRRHLLFPVGLALNSTPRTVPNPAAQIGTLFLPSTLSCPVFLLLPICDN
ncbi:unnamed protein product, partial [Gulo gulo]